MMEFPNRNWSIAALNRLIAKIDATGSAEKRHGGGRPCTAHTMENVDSVEKLVIIHKELQLKCLKKKQAQDLTDANKIARLVRNKQLL